MELAEVDIPDDEAVEDQVELDPEEAVEEPDADVTDDVPRELRRSTRPKKPPDRGPMIAFVTRAAEPETVKEAMESTEAEEGKSAMDFELEALERNCTWEMVSLPPGRKAISSKWVFKKKLNADGSLERYKARLVAKGYSQKRGVDYKETFAPVVNYTTVRCLLTVAATRDLEVHQLDVNTAFLYGDLEEEIYMALPEGLTSTGAVGNACRLKKSLYGLKQSPRQWNRKIHEALLELGLEQSQVDPCLYFRQDNGVQLYVALFVDDMLIACDSLDKLRH